MADDSHIKLFLRQLKESIPLFFKAFGVVRICPDRIAAPNQLLAFNPLTLTVSLAIFVLARLSIGASNLEIDGVLVASLISTVILFLTGFVMLIFAPGPQALVRSKKWGAFFVMLWLISLIVMVCCDAVPFWTGHKPLTTVIIVSLFGPDTLAPKLKDIARAIILGALALGILTIRTKRMDENFRVFSTCTVVTCLLGLVVNTALLVAIMYWHVV